MNQRRGSLYLFTGLILGIALGLAYAWVISPARMVNMAPSDLQIGAKEQFRSLVAMAFLSNGDLVRARARLELLQDKNPYQSLLDQADRLSAGGETGEVTALRLLATAISQNPHQ
jgi:hypothetical protein